MMDLDERKRRILKALINDYITTAEPVGSRTIAKRYGLGISSATIRNEMADLEDMGYLKQPHTSAGRIPSDKGYRVYVDHLMNNQSPTKEEIDTIKNGIYNIAIGEIEKVIKDTSRLLSMLTNYTAIIMSPQTRKSMVKHIQLIVMDSSTVMAIIVTNLGVAKNTMIKLTNPITSDKLSAINNILNDRLKGLTIEEINLSVISEMQKNMTGYKEILSDIIPVLNESLNYVEDNEVFLDGSSNIFNYPEYNAIDKAKTFLSLLDKKEFLSKILSLDSDDMKVYIGHENIYDEINDCSLVIASYKIGNRTAGSVGVIGPTRMYYSKVLPILKEITSCLNDILSEYYTQI